MKIAITGTIGSGKSEVSNYLRSKGFDVFDCDKVNSQLLEKGNIGYFKVKESFKEAFDDDELNKTKLASIVFKNVDNRLQLEEIMHPLIKEEMFKKMSEKDLFFAEVPLLFEKNWDKMFDLSILVVCDEDIALNRLVLRGLDKQDALNRINNQMPVLDKLKRADEIIYNNGSFSLLYETLDKLLLKYAWK